MKKYDELVQAVKDGKFRKHKAVAGFARSFLDKNIDEVEIVKRELFATLTCDDVIDENTKELVLDGAMEALAEKLVADKVFNYSKKIESFDDLFGFLKDAIL